MSNGPKISAPWFLRWTGGLLHETPVDVESKADMLTLFVCAGLTVLGVIGAASLWFYLAPPDHPGFLWVTSLLSSSAVGAACGYFVGAALLGFRSVVRFEKRAARSVEHS